MPEEAQELVDLACEYADQGYHVLPLWISEDGADKRPLIKWGSKASKDHDDIREMPWEDATHVAVACEPSGIVVIDIDTFYDEETETEVLGEGLLPQWTSLAREHGENRPELLDPQFAETGRQGLHIPLRADPDKPMTNSVKDLAACIDIRGIGGLIAVYSSLPDVDQLPVIPEWLYELAKRESAHLTPPAPPEAPKYGDGEAGTDYGLKALEGELKAIRDSWDRDAGTFNADLNRASYAVGQLAGGGELDVGEAHQAIADLLLELGASDQFKTLDSGLTSGYDRPRSRKQIVLEETNVSDEEIDAFTAKWYDSTGLDNIPPPEWLLPGWIEKNSLCQVIGPGNSGKTFVVLDMACRLSRGMAWPKAEVEPDRAHRVAFVAAEGVSGVRDRKLAWEAQHGPVGEMIFYPDAIQINSHEWNVAIQALKRWHPSLIVIDTQSQCTVGVDENTAKDMSKIAAAVKKMRLETQACVLLIHHTSKSGETARGSNVIFGAIETELTVVETRSGLIKVSNTKQKNAQKANKIFFELRDAGPSVVPFAMANMNQVGLEGVQRSNIKMLVSQWLQEQHIPRTTNEIFDGLEDVRSRPRVVTALNELAREGTVIKTTQSRDGRNQSVYLWNPPSQ